VKGSSTVEEWCTLLNAAKNKIEAAIDVDAPTRIGDKLTHELTKEVE
jgi:hypothetical protein